MKLRFLAILLILLYAGCSNVPSNENNSTSSKITDFDLYYIEISSSTALLGLTNVIEQEVNLDLSKETIIRVKSASITNYGYGYIRLYISDNLLFETNFNLTNRFVTRTYSFSPNLTYSTNVRVIFALSNINPSQIVMLDILSISNNDEEKISNPTFFDNLSNWNIGNFFNINPKEKTLRLLASLRGIYIGAAVTPDPLKNEPLYSNTLVREFNMVVPENHMKFELIEPSSNNFDYANADLIVNTAIANNMKIRGHTLLWHLQSSWVSTIINPTAISNILSNHIYTVMKRYSNKVSYWDVVNEAIDDDPTTSGYPNSLRKSFWWTNLGNQYVEYAFSLARAADPTAKLFYNDYGNEGYNGWNNKSYETFLLVSNLKAKGLIDGVGLQMHIDTSGYPMNDNFAANLQRLAGLGVEIHITEVDVRIPMPAKDIDINKQADIYKQLFTMALSNQNVKAILLWGFTDKYSWIPWFYDNSYGDALIFDKNYNRKKAYYAIMEALE
ncbi:MAG: endo-1,4-beta-xylanase [Brevinematia bacterium]